MPPPTRRSHTHRETTEDTRPGRRRGLLLTACGSSPPAEPAPAVPHGYVEGAEETAEPQSRLVIADARTGAVRVLDLLTGTVTRLDDVAGVRDISTDGRFAYLAAGGSTQVIDSGAWMVDHGDHVHYYRAAIRPAGAVDGHVVAAHADSAVAALAVEGGKTVLLDRAAQEDGKATRRTVLDGVAVPYAQHLVVASADGVTVRNRDGRRVANAGEPCREPSGTAPTRRGVVVGCADGALLLSEDDGRFTGAKIPYPDPGPSTERAREFTSRPGSATLTASAGSAASGCSTWRNGPGGWSAPGRSSPSTPWWRAGRCSRSPPTACSMPTTPPRDSGRRAGR
ncbi:hypothetical protein ACFSVJ_29845 [Prauserella oleivorans]